MQAGPELLYLAQVTNISQAGRLHFLAVDGNHLQLDEKTFNRIIAEFLT